MTTLASKVQAHLDTPNTVLQVFLAPSFFNEWVMREGDTLVSEGQILTAEKVTIWNNKYTQTCIFKMMNREFTVPSFAEGYAPTATLKQLVDATKSEQE